MKTLLLIGFLTMSTSALACSCYGLNLGEAEVQEAALNFMENKRGIEEEQISSIETKFETEYIRTRDKIIFNVVETIAKIFDEEAGEFSDCERACMAVQNQKHSAVVTYENNNGESCTQDLVVRLQAHIMDDGFKSIVKKKVHPVCE